MKLHHVAVVCRSRKNADQFYKDVLRLKTIKEKTLDEDFMHQLFGVAVSSELVLYGNEKMAIEVFVPSTLSDPPSSLAHSCLAVDNRKDFIERCQGAGVTVTEVSLGESRVVFVQDYDGNQFEIKEEA